MEKISDINDFNINKLSIDTRQENKILVTLLDESIRIFSMNDVIDSSLKKEICYVEYIGYCDFSVFSDYWLKECPNLKSVKLPEGIKKINDDVFKSSKSLQEVILPTTLKEIGKYSFYGCRFLKEIIIPDDVTMIGESSFADCRSLKKVVLPKKIKKIGCSCFLRCTSLEEVVIPEGVVKIDIGAFSGCESLKKIELPKKLHDIGNTAFSYCYSLERVYLPETLSSIGMCAFEDCRLLKEIIIPNCIKTIAPYTFNCCVSLERVILSDNIQEIGKRAFRGCTSLKKIELPKEMSFIRESSFEHCRNLEEVIFPEKIHTIEKYAFANCTSLKVVNLPQIVHLCEFGFQNCINLEDVFLDDNCLMNSYVFLDCGIKKFRLPAILNGRIKPGMLLGCNRLKKLIIPYENSYSLLKNFKIMLDEQNKLKKKCKFKDKNNYSYFSRSLEEIVFVGEFLSPLTRKRLERDIRKLGRDDSFIGCIFGTTINELDSENNLELDECLNNLSEEINLEQFDQETRNLIQQIQEISVRTSKELNSYLEQRIRELINEYEEQKKQEKPKLDYDDSNFITLNPTMSGNAKVELKINLQNIIFLLTRQEQLLKVLNKLEEYIQILENNNNEWVDNPKEIGDFIKNITIISNSLDEEKKNETLNKVKLYLEQPKKEYEELLKKNLTSKINLELNFTLDPELELLQKIEELYQEVFSYSKKIAPYLTLLGSLKIESNSINAYTEKDGIDSILSNIRYFMMNYLSNDKDLKKDFNLIVEKYIRVLEESILSKKIGKDNYIQLELSLRKELHPILEKIDYQIRFQNSHQGFIEELSGTLNSLKTNTEDNNCTLLNLFINDINQIVLTADLEKNEVQVTKQRICSILKEGLDELSMHNCSDEIQQVKQRLFVKLAEVELRLQMYKKEKVRYEESYEIYSKNKVK